VGAADDELVPEMITTLPVIILTEDGPMAQGSSPELLRELLETYEYECDRMGSPIERALAPGISEQQVRATLAEVGLVANDEVVTWFAWHDGERDDLEDPSLDAMPQFLPASLFYAVKRYRDSVLEFEPPYGTDVPWEYFMFGAGEGWLMLMDSSRGCAIDCFAELDRSTPPRIRSASENFLESGSERLYRAVSLCTLVTWWLEGLRTGAYIWDESEQHWKIDPYLEPASRRNALFS
jgi:hypothetical protein